jgi:hypothetical protein
MLTNHVRQLLEMLRASHEDNYGLLHAQAFAYLFVRMRHSHGSVLWFFLLGQRGKLELTGTPDLITENALNSYNVRRRKIKNGF